MLAAAALIGGAVIAGLGGLLIWLGRGVSSGRFNPNMHHHTTHNTTAESWARMRTATGAAVARCGWVWIAAGVVIVVFAPAGAALLLMSSLWLLVQVFRAAGHLEAAR